MKYVSEMTSPFLKSRIREVVVTRPKTVADLLRELDLSDDHVVLVDGKRVDSDTVLDEQASVVVLPLIAGG